MKIGIVGYGKMGKDIFSLFFDKLDGTEFVVLDTFGAEENTAALIKALDKSLKRKKITEEQYEQKKSSFLFTDKTGDLAGWFLQLSELATVGCVAIFGFIL